MSENIVSVNNLSVSFDYQENFLSKKQKIKAVNNINIKIKKGSFFGLVGESGSGKTTLGRAILGANKIWEPASEHCKKFDKEAVPTAKTRLDDIVYSELRQELGTHDMVEIITENRELIMDKVTVASNEETSKYGIEVVDVRIRRVDLPRENEASIYARMEAERKRQANKFRSEGEEEAQKIRAATDRDKTVILADAYKKAQEIRGLGEAKALDIYASSFSKSPDFYEFIRTLETYEKIIDKKTTLVLPGDSKLLKELTR